MLKNTNNDYPLFATHRSTDTVIAGNTGITVIALVTGFSLCALWAGSARVHGVAVCKLHLVKLFSEVFVHNYGREKFYKLQVALNVRSFLFTKLFLHLFWSLG